MKKSAKFLLGFCVIGGLRGLYSLYNRCKKTHIYYYVWHDE